MARLSRPWPSPLRRRLIRLYDTLVTRYGPPDPWPARSAFEAIVRAILTQNAAGVNVKPVVARLRRAGAASPAGLEALPPARLPALLRPLRPAGPLAARLRAFAVHLRRRHGGRPRAMLAQPVDTLREELLALPGVSSRTADAILLHAAGRAVFVVDAAARRILARHGLVRPETRPAALRTLVHDHLPHDPALFGELHALLGRVAREHCGAVPRCDRCPLRFDLRGRPPRPLSPG